jgi:L-threonylcarbamoyladenylate synthase
MDFKSESLPESFTDKIRRINPKTPTFHIIEEAVLKMRSGGVIVFPTAQLYGLGADALNSHAVLKVFQIKRRHLQKALPVLIGDMAQLSRLVITIPLYAKSIIKKFWPGNVTLICDALASVPSVLTAGTGKIAVRMAGHPVASALVREMNGPITGTSANLSGFPGANAISQIDPALAKEVDLILDAGILGGGVGSTIVDVTHDVPAIVREGSVSAARILNAVKHHAQGL